MSNITELEKSLTHSEDNLLLWLDNTQELYNKLQQINKDSIEEYRYYTSRYIKQEYSSEIIHTRKVAYRKLLLDTIRYMENNGEFESTCELKDINIHKMSKYLYLRELDNIRFNCETFIHTIDTIKEVLEK